MFVAVVLFVIVFGSSSALSAAYGASVVGTMLITTLLGALVARSHWNWSWTRVGALFGLMLLVDLAFVAGNFTKIDDGGWVPLVLAAAMFAMFVTWRDGRQALRAEDCQVEQRGDIGTGAARGVGGNDRRHARVAAGEGQGRAAAVEVDFVGGALVDQALQSDAGAAEIQRQVSGQGVRKSRGVAGHARRDSGGPVSRGEPCVRRVVGIAGDRALPCRGTDRGDGR